MSTRVSERRSSQTRLRRSRTLVGDDGGTGGPWRVKREFRAWTRPRPWGRRPTTRLWRQLHDRCTRPDVFASPRGRRHFVTRSDICFDQVGEWDVGSGGSTRPERRLRSWSTLHCSLVSHVSPLTNPHPRSQPTPPL